MTDDKPRQKFDLDRLEKDLRETIAAMGEQFKEAAKKDPENVNVPWYEAQSAFDETWVQFVLADARLYNGDATDMDRVMGGLSKLGQLVGYLVETEDLPLPMAITVILKEASRYMASSRTPDKEGVAMQIEFPKAN